MKSLNRDLSNIYSYRKFLNYSIGFETVFDNSQEYYGNRTPQIKVETAYFLASFPLETRYATSQIYKYLTEINKEEIIDKYKELQPFLVTVQSLNRTFVDKVCAICDYYLETMITGKNKINKHSRHLYDLYKLFPLVKDDPELKRLIIEVNSLRFEREKSYCSHLGYDVNSVFKMIIDKDVYKDDYTKITQPSLYKDVTYDQTIDNLNDIINSGLFSDGRKLTKEIIDEMKKE